MDDKQLTTTELIAKISNPQYLKFLELYPQCKCQVKMTAEAMGVTFQTVFNWLKKDSEFLECFESIKKDLNQVRLESYLAIIKDIAEDTSVPPQSRLLASFFEVKKLDPAYRDRQEGTKVFTGDIVIECNIPDSETPPDIPFIEGEVVKELDSG